MFEWSPGKEAVNRTKHGVGFDEASTVFVDALAVCFSDPEHSANEERLILVGYSAANRLLFVSHQDLGENIRIISARPATTLERKRHEQHS